MLILLVLIYILMEHKNGDGGNMKYYEAKNMLQLLNKMSVVDIAIPIKTGIRILQNKQLLITAILPYNTIENDVIKNYSNGKPSLTPEDEEYEVCSAKVNDVLNEEVSGLEFDKINIDELADLKLPMSAITAIYPMLEVKE